MSKKIVKTINKQNIGYQGKVKVKIVSGKKVLKTQTYYNNGRNELFKYICCCLMGLYDNDTMPNRIKLFTIAAGESETTAFDESQFNSQYSASPYIPKFITPVIAEVGSSTNDDMGYTITYHFRIPFQRISKDKVYKAALYNNNANDPKQMLAWFKFKDAAGKFEPIEVDHDTNYNIIIEWTMIVSNKEN